MVTARPASESLYALLSDIPDPEIPVISIKDLGILRDVRMEGEHCVVTITPTYTACPAMGWIADQIRNRLRGVGISDVDVNLSYSPAWTTDWLSPEAKQRMREYGIAPPVHSSCSKVRDVAEQVHCPRCGSGSTELLSRFGSTACKALYRCQSCREVFDYFKCH